MRDPRPLSALLVLEFLALLGLGAWWITLPAGERLSLLRAIWIQEGHPTVSPAAVIDQLLWLWEVRCVLGKGLVILVGLGGVVGVVEGEVQRRRDLFGGFRLARWTLGMVGVALLPGVALGLVLWPWPLGAVQVGLGSAVLVGLTGYLCAAGRPQVS